MDLVYPQKFAYQCIAFDFSWELCNTQEKSETKGMHFFVGGEGGGGGGLNKVHYGLGENNQWRYY